MKHSVFTVVLPELTIEEQTRAMAEWGYQGVEWRVANSPMEYQPGQPFNFWNNRVEDIWVGALVKEAPRLRRLAEENGLETVSLAGYSQCSDVKAMEALCEGCEITGARFFRVHVTRYDGKVSYNTLYEEAVRDLERVAKMAAEHGVRACLELHPGTIHPSAAMAHRLLSHFDPKCVGVIYDAGNLSNEGYEETKMGLELLGEYLAYLHVKDGGWLRTGEGAESQLGQALSARDEEYVGPPRGWRWEVGRPGEGLANWPKVMKALKVLGYDGWFSNEDFREEPATEEKLRQDMEYLRMLEKEV